jgi:hypothetical protein
MFHVDALNFIQVIIKILIEMIPKERYNDGVIFNKFIANEIDLYFYFVIT